MKEGKWEGEAGMKGKKEREGQAGKRAARQASCTQAGAGRALSPSSGRRWSAWRPCRAGRAAAGTPRRTQQAPCGKGQRKGETIQDGADQAGGASVEGARIHAGTQE